MLLLKDRMTDWTANAMGKKCFGRGYACSRYTTSEPLRFGKKLASSRNTQTPAHAIRKPMTQ